MTSIPPILYELLSPLNAKNMTHDQEQLIIKILEDDIKKYSVEARSPMVQTWADGRVEDVKEAMTEFRKLLSDNERNNHD